jgi:hypothetical protein
VYFGLPLVDANNNNITHLILNKSNFDYSSHKKRDHPQYVSEPFSSVLLNSKNNHLFIILFWYRVKPKEGLSRYSVARDDRDDRKVPER